MPNKCTTVYDLGSLVALAFLRSFVMDMLLWLWCATLESNLGNAVSMSYFSFEAEILGLDHHLGAIWGGWSLPECFFGLSSLRKFYEQNLCVYRNFSFPSFYFGPSTWQSKHYDLERALRLCGFQILLTHGSFWSLILSTF